MKLETCLTCKVNVQKLSISISNHSAKFVSGLKLNMPHRAPKTSQYNNYLKTTLLSRLDNKLVNEREPKQLKDSMLQITKTF